MGHNNTKTSTQIEDFRPRPHDEQPVPDSYVRDHPEVVETLNLELRDGHYWEGGRNMNQRSDESLEQRNSNTNKKEHHLRQDLSRKVDDAKESMKTAGHQAAGKGRHFAAGRRNVEPSAAAEHAFEVGAQGAVTEGLEAAVLPPNEIEGLATGEVTAVMPRGAENKQPKKHFWSTSTNSTSATAQQAPREEWTRDEKPATHFWQRDAPKEVNAPTQQKQQQQKPQQQQQQQKQQSAQPAAESTIPTPAAVEREERYRQVRDDIKREERVAADKPWPQEKALDGQPIQKQMEDQSWLNQQQRDQRYERQADKEGINWQQQKADAQLDRGVDQSPNIKKAGNQ